VRGRHRGGAWVVLLFGAGLGAALLAAPSPRAAAGTAGEATRWLADYLRLDTTNPPGHEEVAAAYLAGLLERAGVPSRRLTSPRGRTSLYARLRAGAADGPAVLLLHHLDVVPAGPGWTVGPFAGTTVEGRLFGRGAIDDKSLGIAHLAALVDLARAATPLRRDVVLLAVADEESGGGEGTAWLLEQHPELFAGVEAVLVEGGYNKTVLGKARWWGLEVAQKRPLWLEVVARGRAGHASQLNPQSAAHQLIAGLARLLARPAPPRLEPSVRRLLAALAPYEVDLAPLATAPAGPLPATLVEPLPPRLRTYVVDSVQVTTLAAGDQVNMVAGEARARIDVRLLPEADADAFLAEVRRALGPELEVRVLLASPVAAASPTDTPIYEGLARALRGEGPVVPLFIPGITDARYFRARGIAAYGFSPFCLDYESERGIHGPDELIPVAELERGVERMRRVVRVLVARDR
jgi:acetylornithine deacetylase/succinyl-diaminopimelate desuccinylase-like protein